MKLAALVAFAVVAFAILAMGFGGAAARGDDTDLGLAMAMGLLVASIAVAYWRFHR